jgi:hypothetical protein
MAVAGACAEQEANAGGGADPNAYSLQRIKDKYDTGTDVPNGRNFNFVENDSAWMTGMRVHGSNMYISNRGNNNHLDSDSVKLFKLAITSSNGAPDQTLDLGTSTFTSIDGFDIANGTNLLICGFHSSGIKSATLATAHDLSSTFTITGTKTIVTGMRGCSWGDSGNKYYVVYASIKSNFLHLLLMRWRVAIPKEHQRLFLLVRLVIFLLAMMAILFGFPNTMGGYINTQ